MCSSDLRDEVAPKNIIMIGPTGVGKTEIARRLAHLIKAPFTKVEATKYTEVGYHGRDVESIVRDLVEISVGMVRQEHSKRVEEKAKIAVEEKLLDILLPIIPKPDQLEEESAELSPEETPGIEPDGVLLADPLSRETTENDLQRDMEKKRNRSREKMAEKLRTGKLEKRTVEIVVEDRAMPMVEVFSSAGIDQVGMEIQNMFEKIVPSRQATKKVTVAEARKILMQQESEKLIDREKVIREAIDWAENMGIIFVDELDKVVGSEHKHGPDISREGVQRDLLPIVEGSSTVTRYGMVRSDHILFIAAGAFSSSKPSDLIPELQGRFPIRVELKPLTQKDFVAILTEPRNALIKQYQELLKTEGLELSFTDESIAQIAYVCEQVNQKMQNIGARRLHTILEKLLEDISFIAPEMKEKKVVITAEMVNEKLNDIVKDEDLSHYIL